MHIPVKPTTLTLPGKGSFVVNLVDIRVVSYELSKGASSFYELLNKTVIKGKSAVPAKPAVLDPETGAIITEAVPEVPAVPDQDVVTSSDIIGNYSIPAADFAKWGTDDNVFIDSVLTHLNLVRV